MKRCLISLFFFISALIAFPQVETKYYSTPQQSEKFYHIPLPTSVTSPPDKSANRKSVNSNFLDLSGRRLPTLPTRKGIYIKDGRKVLIK